MRKLGKLKSIFFVVLTLFLLDPLLAKDPKEAEIRSYAKEYLDEFLIKQPLCLNPQSEESKNFYKKYYLENTFEYPGGATRQYVIDTYHFGNLKKKDGKYWLEIVFHVKGYLIKGIRFKLREKQKRYFAFLYENDKVTLSSEYGGFFFPESCIALQNERARERERKEKLKNTEPGTFRVQTGQNGSEK
ncbi:hypothetical protein [Leptospira noguchii]|uniref:hypothetical protein n=1 Tax=Leptospira noguchii TaxID=28182 RepID=UPI0003284773|nr:hypothetical protein [Leptospira noguchii]EMS85385.1 hypothetical protein LEP1GSC073_1092 [Leptospira noguchii str. Cascata]